LSIDCSCRGDAVRPCWGLGSAGCRQGAEERGEQCGLSGGKRDTSACTCDGGAQTPLIKAQPLQPRAERGSQPFPERAQLQTGWIGCADLAILIFGQSLAQVRGCWRGPQEPRSIQIPEQERGIGPCEIPKAGIVRNCGKHGRERYLSVRQILVPTHMNLTTGCHLIYSSPPRTFFEDMGSRRTVTRMVAFLLDSLYRTA